MEERIVDEPLEDVLDTRLKYQYLIDEHNLSSPCPDRCKPVSSFLYRFVSSSDITDSDFRPSQIEDEEKKIFRKRNGDQSKCLMCAVSFFDSEKNANAMLTILSGRQNSHFEGKLIAVGLISDTDGLASAANQSGHISFYEYINSNIYLKFETYK